MSPGWSFLGPGWADSEWDCRRANGREVLLSEVADSGWLSVSPAYFFGELGEEIRVPYYDGATPRGSPGGDGNF